MVDFSLTTTKYKLKEFDSLLTSFNHKKPTKKQLLFDRVGNIFYFIELNSAQEVYLDHHNVYRFVSNVCPYCGGTDTVDNGYHKSESKLVQELGLKLKGGHKLCFECGEVWTVSLREFLRPIRLIKKFIQRQAVVLKSMKIPLPKIVTFINLTIGAKVSHQTVENWFRKYLDKLPELDDLDEFSGIYSYDEQYLKVNGIKKFRATILDAITNLVVKELLVPEKKKEVIKQFLSDLPKKPIAFIIDRDPSYPEIFKELYPHAKLQFCIFHLFKNINWEYFKKFGSLFGKRKKIPLCEELKKQELFDVFYPREKIIKFLREALQKELSDEEEKKVRKQLQQLKKEYLPDLEKHSEKEARKKFDLILTMKQYYPKYVVSLLDKIDKDWDRFSLYLRDKRVPPTNNVIEQFYSQTLQQKEKVKWRSDRTLDYLFKLFRVGRRRRDWIAEAGLNITLIGLLKIFAPKILVPNL